MNKTIEKMQYYFNMKFSDEQIKILECGFDKPTLINACAGAGKTTMLELSIIYNALEGKILPKHVLGITFSRNSAEDMEEKYQKFVNMLPDELIQDWGEPDFSTFHALFWKLVRRLPNGRSFEVIPDYTKYSQKFDLPNKSEELTASEQLKELFDKRSQLINSCYSFNGLNINRNNQIVRYLEQTQGEADLLTIINYLTHSARDQKWFENYQYAMNVYNQEKIKDLKVDFDDLGLIVLKSIKDNEQIISLALRKYQLVFIDEFQDINELQWLNIKSLFDLNRIVAVGDDDQAIYTFRGSSPKFILNFEKAVPNAQKFNLSTNYRTGDAILNVVSDSIALNRRRLGKKLRAFNHGGNVVTFTKNVDEMLSTFLKKAKTNSDETFAILVRYNLDRTIVADRLADHGIYVKLRNKWQILQEDTIFDIYYQLMRAFYHDDFDLFLNYSNRIGFKKYMNYVKQIRSRGNVHSISDFVAQAFAFDPVFGRMTVGSKHDLHVKKALECARKVKDGKAPLTRLYAEVSELTKQYFKVMIETYHHFSNEKRDALCAYLQSQIEKYDNFEDFEQAQDDKYYKMLDALDGEENAQNIALETLHGSKGLEWDNVCLYGLTDAEIDRQLLELAEKIPANLRYIDFIDKLADEDLMAELTEAKNDTSLDAINIFQNSCEKQCDCPVALLGKVSQDVIEALKREEEPLSSAGKLLYQSLIGISRFIEDERRLLYVGVTRAKKFLCIDMTGNYSPLLDELKNIS